MKPYIIATIAFITGAMLTHASLTAAQVKTATQDKVITVVDDKKTEKNLLKINVTESVSQVHTYTISDIDTEITDIEMQIVDLTKRKTELEDIKVELEFELSKLPNR